MGNTYVQGASVRRAPGTVFFLASSGMGPKEKWRPSPPSLLARLHAAVSAVRSKSGKACSIDRRVRGLAMNDLKSEKSRSDRCRSEEHTSELQSPIDIS